MLSKEMQEKLIGEIKRSDKFIELIGIKIIEYVFSQTDNGCEEADM